MGREAVAAPPAMTFLLDAAGGVSRRELLAHAAHCAAEIPSGTKVFVATSSVRGTLTAVLATMYAGSRPVLVGQRGSPVEPGAVVLDDELRAGPLQLPRLPQGPELTSSGTSGSAHRHRHGVPTPRMLAQHLAVPRALPRRPSRLGVAVPPTSSHGWAALMAAWWLGVGLLDLHRLPPANARKLLSDSGTDAITGIPDQLPGLLVAGVRMAISGSDRLAPETSRVLSEQVELVNVYGATEAGPIAVATPADLRRVPGCVGRPAPGVILRIVGGVLEVRTPVGRGRTFRTDRAHLEQGLLVIDGRADGRPTRRGELPDVERTEAVVRALAGVTAVHSQWADGRWTLHVQATAVGIPDLRRWLIARAGIRDTPDEIEIAP
ncbi:acyl--CoA ligase [Calidifontibacter sp. DB0510]|uniref:Acyl--CoA ligase n=1 Tax=Metallococcus carri TaxID=1656884 RepID=A0A967EHU6_9MICO|nr:class I adenylate-forming enzyme family protein [Metallococcus carri]NHN57123.1 acyl--CoA ligase [Metallococcus carri]NOP39008.1 acyl--CoA ligase [Calidifontibacter sp. DB2511S]